MNEYWLGLFLFFWAVTDRPREIAVFPGWKSIFGKWWETHYNENVTTLWPFRSAYHTFKNLAVLFFMVMIWWHYGFITCLSMLGIWVSGQFLGLLSRKNIN